MHMEITSDRTAAENLVGFSIAQQSLFKRHQLLPVRDLKLLVRDYPVCDGVCLIREDWS